MKIKQRMHVVKWFSDEPSLQGHKSSTPSCVELGEIDIEFDFDMPSDLEIRDKKIAALKSGIKKERADSDMRVEYMEHEIQKLYALELSE